MPNAQVVPLPNESPQYKVNPPKGATPQQDKQAKSWEQISSEKWYEELSDPEREVVKRQYFNKIIAPTVKQRDQLPQKWKEFDSFTKGVDPAAEPWYMKYAPEIGGTVGGLGGMLAGPEIAVPAAMAGAAAGSAIQEGWRREHNPALAQPDTERLVHKMVADTATAGAGELVGQGLNVPAKMAIRGVRGAFTPVAGAKEAQELLQKYGGSLSVGQATEHDAAELIARETFFGKGPFAKLDKANQLAIVKAKNELVGDLTSTPQGQVIIKSGQGLQDVIDASDKKFSETAAALYRQVDRAVESSMRPTLVQAGKVTPRRDIVRMGPIKEYADKLASAYEARGTPIPQALKDFMNTPDRLSFEQAQLKRSDMLVLSRGAERSSSEQAPLLKKYYDELAKRIDAQMEDAARNMPRAGQSGYGPYEAYRQASEFWKTGQKTFRSDVITDLAATNPEDIAGKLFRPGNVSEIENVKGMLAARARIDPSFDAKKAWSEMQAAWLVKQFETKGAIDITKEAKLKGGYLAKLLDTGADRRTFEAVFDETQRQGVERFFKAVELSQRLENKLFAVGVPILQAGAIGTLIKVGSSSLSSVGGAAALLLGPRVLAKALTNPNLVNKLVGAMRRSTSDSVQVITPSFMRDLTDLGAKLVHASYSGGKLVLNEAAPTFMRTEGIPAAVDLLGPTKEPEPEKPSKPQKKWIGKVGSDVKDMRNWK